MTNLDTALKASNLISWVWSLIAVTSESNDFKVDHMRNLWLKLVVMLENNDGICLIAFGIPLDYLIIAEVS